MVCEEDTRIILVQVECRYIQLVLLMYLALICSKGLQTVEGGTGAPSLWCVYSKELEWIEPTE